MPSTLLARDCMMGAWWAVGEQRL